LECISAAKIGLSEHSGIALEDTLLSAPILGRRNMQAILDLLIQTLIERFSDAGFEVPEAMSQKEKESFVLSTLESAVIPPSSQHHQLVEAAHEVVKQWESTRLAEAVRHLDAVLAQDSPQGKGVGQGLYRADVHHD
jgi:hypothetical protein